jgi:hypothetical protein
VPRHDLYVEAEARARRIGKFASASVDEQIVALEPEPRPKRRRRAAAASGPGQPGLAPGLSGRATPLTIIAQDPDKVGRRNVPLLTTVSVPAERVLPGPRDHRFFVVDYRTDGQPAELLRLTEAVAGERDEGWRLVDRFARPTRRELLTNPAFHAQNVFAICVWLLNRFEEVLGRRVPWGFGSHHLYLVPHAFVGANAGYSPDDHCIRFGYLPATGRAEPVLTCLSHDVIAHELTHAILDGLRPRYIEPGLPDQLAFHEGFADIVALLAVFSRPPVVARLLTEAKGEVDAALFQADHLRRSALFTIGDQLGAVLDPTRSGLRQSLADVPRGRGWRASTEAHRRGEVLVAAVSEAVVRIWSSRLVDLRRQGTVPLQRAAEEGSKSAEHVLGMCIRALDYLPPIELELEDFLDAILVADEIVAPDDTRHYRDIVEGAFAEYDLHRPAGERISSDNHQHPYRYQGINRKALGTSTDEIYRFLWQNADRLDIDLDHYLHVERVLSVTRTGPDGLVIEEIVADYVQTISAPLQALPESWRAGVPAPPETVTQCWGGGVVAFNQYGVPRHHVTKSLLDPGRQHRRLTHLATNGLYDTGKRLGFSHGTSDTKQFQVLHEPGAKERW